METDKKSHQIKEKANMPINPPDNWSDIELRENSKRTKGPAEK